MPITYDAPSNTITITGYSEATPANLEDIYQADIAGAWGVVSKQGNDQYLIDAHLYIGTDTTSGWFADEAKQLVMTNLKDIWTKIEGHTRFGELLNEAEATTGNSCMILMDLTSATYKLRCDGEFEFYGSNFLNSTRGSGVFYLSPDVDTNKIRLWNCYISEIGYVYEYGQFGSVAKNWIRSTISNNLYGLNLTTGNFPPEHFNDTLVQGCDYGVRNTWLGYTGDETITVRNLWIKDSQNEDFNFYNWGVSGTADFYAIDTVCDWTFYWSGGSMENDRSQFHRQYSFNLRIVDEDGSYVDNAKVECWDKDDNLLFTVYTGAMGTIAEQIITYGIYRPTRSITLETSGYVDCVSSDLFKQVQDDGVEIGELVGYDNSTRTWYISTRYSILAGSIMTITAGTGGGTCLTGSGAYIVYLIEKSPHRIKVSKDSEGYNHIDYIGDINEPIDWTLTLTHPCHPWDTDKIEALTAPGYDHSNVANYPMSWNDTGNILTIWGDDGSGGKEPMGYDADNPITMEYVWAFSAYTKGTCICTKDSDDAFTMKARLIIGDGTAVTFFASENQSVWQYDYFKVKNNATMRIGSVATDPNNPYPDPKWGATWTIERVTKPDSFNYCYFVESGGELYIYDSRIALTDNSKCFDTEIGAYTLVRYSTFAGYDRLDTTYIRWWGVLEFDHMVLHHCRNMNFPTPPDPNSAYLNIYDNQNDLQVRDAESWIYDATLANAIVCAIKVLKFAGLDPGQANLVDPIGLDYNMICVGNTLCWVKLWHRFAIKVKDAEDNPIVGAKVVVKDIDSVEVYNETTDVTGWTTMQLIREWQTQSVTGSPIIYPDNFDIRNPHTLKVTKRGFQTYETRLDITKRMDTEEIRLETERVVIDTEVIR